MTYRQALAAVLLLAFVAPGAVAQPESPPSTAAAPRFRWSVDFTFAGVRDESLRASMGRERQIKPVAAILALDVRVSPRLSVHFETNPVRDDRAPKPYVPLESDRRAYFFPNQPNVLGARGVASQPEGLYKVDAYKHSGLDPILQVYMLRTGYGDVHTASGAIGLRFGRFYVQQGLALDELTWFTAKDLTTIQLLNAQADNGVSFYWRPKAFQLTTQVISGNGSPYQDYAYFDFTDAVEDKNSAVGMVIDARTHVWHDRLMVGGSYRRNYLNSRIEDSITVHLSKHRDDARMVYAQLSGPRVQVYAELATYVVGLAASSADLLPGPSMKGPVNRSGFYAGTKFGPLALAKARLSAVVEQEVMSRNDALVAFAEANDLYGARLGAHIKATNAKLISDWGDRVSGFLFIRLMTNPFPELSAIKAVSGPNSDRAAKHTKVGVGVRVRF